MTTYRAETRPRSSVREVEHPPELADPTTPHRDGMAAHPAPLHLERAARAVDRRERSAWKNPLVVVVVAYVAMAAALLAVGAVIVHTPLGDPIRSWDETLSRNVSIGRTSGWSDYSELGTSGANTVPVVGAMVVVTLVLAALRRWRDMLLLPLGLGLELSTFLTVNYLVGRERPDVAQLGGEPGTNSFPSGHVAATFVLFGGVALLLGIWRWRVPWRILGWIVVAVGPLSVAFSRVYRGMHYTTDVLAGLTLGAMALAAAALATRSSWLGAHRDGPGASEGGR